MYGLKVRTADRAVQVDGANYNYVFSQKINATTVADTNSYGFLHTLGTTPYQRDITFTNAYYFDITFAAPLDDAPLIGFRSTATSGAIKYFKKDGSGQYTGVYIQADESIGVGVGAEIFVYTKPWLTTGHGLICRNATDDVIYNSSLTPLQIQKYKTSNLGGRPWVNSPWWKIGNYDFPFSWYMLTFAMPNNESFCRFSDDSGRDCLKMTSYPLAQSVTYGVHQQAFTHDDVGELPIFILGYYGVNAISGMIFNTSWSSVYAEFHVLTYIGIKNVSNTSSLFEFKCGGQLHGSYNSGGEYNGTGGAQVEAYNNIYTFNPNDVGLNNPFEMQIPYTVE